MAEIFMKIFGYRRTDGRKYLHKTFFCEPFIYSNQIEIGHICFPLIRKKHETFICI